MNEAWVRAMHDLVAARSTGAYVNFLHREGTERIRQAYPGADVRPPRGAQAPLGPDQPLPVQPEHRALTGPDQDIAP